MTRQGPKPIDWSLYEKKCEDPGRTYVYYGSRDWSDAAISQGMPRIDGYQQKQGRGKDGLHSKPEREHDLADTLTSNF